MAGIAKPVRENNTLPQTFMWLGFAAAALIIAVQWQEQWQEAATDSATIKTSQSSASAFSPVMTLPGAPAPSESSSKNLKESAQVGLVGILEGVVEPVFALEGTKLIIDLSDRHVYLYQNSTLTATYEIAVGRSGWETPTGEFSVLNMQTDPIWQHPFTGEVVAAGADNPLGSRWIGFWSDGQHQIGLHGTNQEDLIGQAVSHGCIRMREVDVQALYTQITVGMSVTVRV
ncbi:MAG: hypothetical protein Kow00121_41030 [Elainellaceae cyanobacterium]